MDDASFRYEICDLLCRTMVEVPPPGFGITVPSGNASLTPSANAAEFIVSPAERITRCSAALDGGRPERQRREVAVKRQLQQLVMPRLCNANSLGCSLHRYQRYALIEIALRIPGERRPGLCLPHIVSYHRFRWQRQFRGLSCRWLNGALSIPCIWLVGPLLGLGHVTVLVRRRKASLRRLSLECRYCRRESDTRHPLYHFHPETAQFS